MNTHVQDKIIVHNLCKAFDSHGLLNDISFTIRDGEFLSILGPSGCGKTTILRILIGLLEADSGSIIKDGEDVTHLPPSRRGMGIVFQNYALFENMTVLGNVEYALKRRTDLRSAARETAVAMLEAVGLGQHLNKKPRQLSGGQQQRVAIARTLALKPDVILFDEPMSALDVDTRLALRQELKALQKRFGTTMVYITHDQEEAFALSDRIMVMSEGRIHQMDTPRNIIDHPADDYVERFVIRNIRAKINSLIQFVSADPAGENQEAPYA